MASMPASDMTLDRLIAELWAKGADGQGRVRSLLAAIDAVAPAAVDQVQARRLGRLLGLAEV